MLHQKLCRVIFGKGSVGRYAAIGLSGVMIDLMIFLGLLRIGIFPLVATSLSTISGITNNYVWNSLLNFEVKLAGKTGAKFLTVGLTGLVTGAGILFVLTSVGVDPIIAKWTSVPFVVSGQFVANRFWTFQQR